MDVLEGVLRRNYCSLLVVSVGVFVVLKEESIVIEIRVRGG